MAVHSRNHVARSVTRFGRGYLLNASDVLGDVLDGHGLFDGERVALALESCLVDEDARIGRQSGKGERDVIIELHDLAHRAGILQLGHRLLLHTQHEDGLAPHAHLTMIEMN